MSEGGSAHEDACDKGRAQSSQRSALGGADPPSGPASTLARERPGWRRVARWKLPTSALTTLGSVSFCECLSNCDLTSTRTHSDRFIKRDRPRGFASPERLRTPAAWRWLVGELSTPRWRQGS